MGTSLGLCIPTNLSKLFSYQPWKHETVSDIHISDSQKPALAAAKTDDDLVNNRILELVMDLGNTVLKNRAMTELMHIKTKKVPGFKQAALFRKIMTLLECHQFRLNMRRFAIDLFDKNVMRQIVLDEEGSDENLESDEDSVSEGRTERQRSVSDTGPSK
jgi:hypothetical protein